MELPYFPAYKSHFFDSLAGSATYSKVRRSEWDEPMSKHNHLKPQEGALGL